MYVFMGSIGIFLQNTPDIFRFSPGKCGFIVFYRQKQKMWHENALQFEMTVCRQNKLWRRFSLDFGGVLKKLKMQK